MVGFLFRKGQGMVKVGHKYIRREPDPKNPGKFIYFYEDGEGKEFASQTAPGVVDQEKKSKHMQFETGFYKVAQGDRFVTIKTHRDPETGIVTLMAVYDENGQAMPTRWQTVADYLGIKREAALGSKTRYSAYELVRQIGHEQAQHTVEEIEERQIRAVKGEIAEFRVAEKQPWSTSTRYLATDAEGNTMKIDVNKETGMLDDPFMRDIIQYDGKPILNVDDLATAFHNAIGREAWVTVSPSIWEQGKGIMYQMKVKYDGKGAPIIISEGEMAGKRLPEMLKYETANNLKKIQAAEAHIEGNMMVIDKTQINVSQIHRLDGTGRIVNNDKDVRISLADWQDLRDFIGTVKMDDKTQTALQAYIDMQNDMRNIKVEDKDLSDINTTKINHVWKYKQPDEEGEPFDLIETQRAGVKFLTKTGRGVLAHTMGLGKTTTTITSFIKMRQEGRANKMLVIAPANLTAENGSWDLEVKKRITAKHPPEILAGKHKIEGEWNKDSLVYVVSYETFRRNKDAIVKRAKEMGIDTVALDEAQAIKSHESLNYRRLKEAASEAPEVFKNRFVISGTPMENSPLELHSLINFATDGKHSLGDRKIFKRRFIKTSKDGQTLRAENEDELYKLAAPYVQYRDTSDITDPTKRPPSLHIDQNARFTMTDDQKAEYEAIKARVNQTVTKSEEDAVNNLIEGNEVNEKSIVSWFSKQHELVNYANKTKMEHLVRTIRNHMMAEPNAKIVVFSQHSATGTGVDLVSKAMEPLQRELGIGVGKYFAKGGGKFGQRLTTPSKQREADVRRFNSDPACKVMISTDAGATGISYPRATMIINLDHLYNPQKQQQRIFRAVRMGGGAHRTVQEVDLTMADTIDDRILKIQEAKRKIFDRVKSGIKRSIPEIEKNFVLGGGEIRNWKVPKKQAETMKSLQGGLNGTQHHYIIVDDPMPEENPEQMHIIMGEKGKNGAV